MQKGKTMQYAAAGVQSTPGMRMNVRSHVRIPDAEAGSENRMERQPYYATGSQKPVSHRSATLPTHVALIFLTAVFVFFGSLVLHKAVQRAQLSKDISAMETSIAKTLQDNTLLAVDVMKARDSSRICYAAAQRLGMVASSGMEAVPVQAPDTRPVNNMYSMTVSSPLAVQQGSISGSR